MCMNCHKTRRDAHSYASTLVSNANWGPHYSNQAEILLGMNAAQFGETPYLNSPHKFAVGNSCVSCHMPAITDTSNVNRDKVGGHTFRLHNPDTNYDFTQPCQGCHGHRDSFDDFIARFDYDGNGAVESIKKEVYGLIKNLKKALPPVGVEEISWQMIRDTNDVNINKAYYNYRLVGYDRSLGMHNTAFVIDVLRRSTAAIGGFVTDAPISDTYNIPVMFNLSQNYPNPFNPSTTIKYSLPFESNVKLSIYSVTGELVKELMNGYLPAGEHQSSFNASSYSSGVYFYTIEAKPVSGESFFRETKKMVLMK
jgi:hypothetical protein